MNKVDSVLLREYTVGMEKNIILYHGSKNIIEKPIFGMGKLNNDYGLAFYCTQEQDLAKEWAVTKNENGFSNKYIIDVSRLKILDLNSSDYTVIHWITLLLQNRRFNIQTDFGKEAKEYLLANFSIDVSQFDIIKGYRADDSYFSFAEDFLNNNISIKTLSRAMTLGKPGEQYAIKSKDAFDKIKYIDSEIVNYDEWYPKKEKRDLKARTDYHEMRNEKWKRGELYLMNLLDEEMKPDDLRLRSKFTE